MHEKKHYQQIVDNGITWWRTNIWCSHYYDFMNNVELDAYKRELDVLQQWYEDGRKIK